MNAKTWLFGLLAVCAVGLLLSCNDSEVKLLDDPAEDGDTDKASFNPGDDNLDDDDEDGDADDDDNDDADGDNPDGDTPADDDDDTTDDDDDDDDTTEDGDLPDGDTDGDIDDIYVSETPIYVDGLLTVATISVDEGQDEAPVPMLIHTPTQAGEYAVVGVSTWFPSGQPLLQHAAQALGQPRLCCGCFRKCTRRAAYRLENPRPCKRRERPKPYTIGCKST